MNTRWLSLFAASLLPLVCAAPAAADEMEELRSLRATTMNLVNALVEQGVLSREKADALIRQAQQSGSASAPAAAAPQVAAASGAAVAPGVVRVPYVPEAVRAQIRDEVRADVLAQARTERWGDPGTLPDWLKHLSWGGDLRLRGEEDRFPEDNVPNVPVTVVQFPPFGYNINNTTEQRNRLRIRARFGLEAHMGSSVTAGLRLTTGGVGAGSDPGSENQTLGNYNTRASVGFDRAYLTYRPASWATVSGGRLGNPFYSSSTLVWTDDLSLEGVVATLSPHITDALTVFATAGAFPIQDIEPTPLTRADSKWMLGYQLGLHWRLGEASQLHVGAALYDYRHIEGIPNPTLISTDFSLTAAAFRQKGNTVFDINELANTTNGTQNFLFGVAAKFRVANVSASLDLPLFGATHVILDTDFVKNIGFDRQEILARTGLDVEERTRGMQHRITFGRTSLTERNAWQAYVGYRHVERDAVLDAFTETDFRLGGTDASGYFIGGRYAFDEGSNIGIRWLSGKEIDGPPLSIDVLQLDVVTSF